MSTTIEDEIKKIEDILIKYDSISTVKYFAFWLTRIAERGTNPFFFGLKSPYKQLHYLASLALKIGTNGLDTISKDDWIKLSKLVQGIENLYNQAVPKDFLKKKQDELQKMGVSQAAYLNFFFNGTFIFKEQLIERIKYIFNKYDDLIIEDTGLSSNDFLICSELLIKECNIKVNLPLKLGKGKVWKDFVDKMKKMRIPVHQWKTRIPDDNKDAFKTLTDPESILIIDLENLHINCDKQKLIQFLNLFTLKKLDKERTIYYGEKLPLELNPIVKISDTEYLVFYQNEILTAIYEKLFSICVDKVGTKFFKRRDKYIEQKTLEIFELLYNKNKAKIYSNYSLDGHKEQDILIIHNSVALIIEVKAGSFREPMREPIKAFNKITSDFKKNIQEAYNQCLRVEDAFHENEFITVYGDNRVELDIIETSKIKHVFSIIVTLDRFGLIQSDLSHLLEIEDNLPYPWSINIDDLENFLLMLKKQKNAQNKFRQFLENRELLHGKLHATDEMDVCCWFLRDSSDYINGCNHSESYIFANPRESELLDKTYFSKGGLGFKNERNLDLKNEGKTLFLGKPK